MADDAFKAACVAAYVRAETDAAARFSDRAPEAAAALREQMPGATPLEIYLAHRRRLIGIFRGEA